MSTSRTPPGRLARTLLAAALLAGPAAVGCGSGSEGIGDPCRSGADCTTGAASACIVSWPAGYCTEVACVVGSCPSESRCVRGIAFVDVPFDAFCLDTCAGQSDCREGYRCADLALDAMVCVPESA